MGVVIRTTCFDIEKMYSVTYSIVCDSSVKISINDTSLPDSGL
jgi:hypothetical protein